MTRHTVKGKGHTRFINREVALVALYDLDQILAGNGDFTPLSIFATAGPYRIGLPMVVMAVTGKDSSGKALSGSKRLELLDWATGDDQLGAVIAQASQLAAGDDVASRFDTEYLKDPSPQLAELRKGLLNDDARDRVQSSLTIDGEILEIPEDGKAHEQAEALRPHLQKLANLTGDTIERVRALDEIQARSVAEGVEELEGHDKAGLLEKLGHVKEVLDMMDGWLSLTDHKFMSELSEIRASDPRLKDIANFTELMKKMIGMVGGFITFKSWVLSGIARLAGDEALSASLKEFAARLGDKLGVVIAGIEIIHAYAVLLDPKSSSEKRSEAQLSATLAFGTLISAAGATGGLVIAATGVAIGGAAAGSMLLPFYILDLGSGAVKAIDYGALRTVFKGMQEDYLFIRAKADQVKRAGVLKEREKDAGKAAALSVVDEGSWKGGNNWGIGTPLVGVVDAFLDRCDPSADFSSNPDGHYGKLFPVIAEIFAPVLSQRGAQTRDDALAAAAAVLDKIKLCFRYGFLIAEADFRHDHLDKLDEEYRKGLEQRSDSKGD